MTDRGRSASRALCGKSVNNPEATMSNNRSYYHAVRKAQTPPQAAGMVSKRCQCGVGLDDDSLAAEPSVGSCAQSLSLHVQLPTANGAVPPRTCCSE